MLTGIKNRPNKAERITFSLLAQFVGVFLTIENLEFGNVVSCWGHGTTQRFQKRPNSLFLHQIQSILNQSYIYLPFTQTSLTGFLI